MHLTQWTDGEPVQDFDLNTEDGRFRLVEYLDRHCVPFGRWELSQYREELESLDGASTKSDA